MLAEAKEIQKSRLNAGDEYVNPYIHKDISRIISSVCPSEDKLMMNWTKIVHPFLSANCLLSYLEETVAPSEACEHCGISKDFLSSIPDAFVANKLPLSSKVYICTHKIMFYHNYITELRIFRKIIWAVSWSSKTDLIILSGR